MLKSSRLWDWEVSGLEDGRALLCRGNNWSFRKLFVIHLVNYKRAQYAHLKSHSCLFRLPVSDQVSSISRQSNPPYPDKAKIEA